MQFFVYNLKEFSFLPAAATTSRWHATYWTNSDLLASCLLPF